MSTMSKSRARRRCSNCCRGRSTVFPFSRRRFWRRPRDRDFAGAGRRGVFAPVRVPRRCAAFLGAIAAAIIATRTLCCGTTGRSTGRGRFAGPAHGDVAHAYHRHGRAMDGGPADRSADFATPWPTHKALRPFAACRAKRGHPALRRPPLCQFNKTGRNSFLHKSVMSPFYVPFSIL